MQKLGWVAGSAWPEGDEDKMRALADDWRTAAAELRDLLPDLAATRNATINAYPWGRGVEEMSKSLDKLDHGPQSIEKLAEIFDKIAESADAMGSEIEYTKWMIYSSLGLLAIELALALWNPFTAPLQQAMSIAATRLGIRMLAQRVLHKIESEIVRRLLVGLLKFTAQHVAISTAIGAGQDLAIQLLQMAQGNRKDFDWKRFGVTAGSAAAGGALGGGAGTLLGKGASHIRLPGGRVGEGFKGAVVGITAGNIGGVGSFYAGNFLNYGTDTDKWSAFDPRVLSSSTAFGGVAGGIKGFRGASAVRPGGTDFRAPDRGGMGGPDGSAPVRPENGGGQPSSGGSPTPGEPAAARQAGTRPAAAAPSDGAPPEGQVAAGPNQHMAPPEGSGHAQPEPQGLSEHPGDAGSRPSEEGQVAPENKSNPDAGDSEVLRSGSGVPGSGSRPAEGADGGGSNSGGDESAGPDAAPKADDEGPSGRESAGKPENGGTEGPSRTEAPAQNDAQRTNAPDGLGRTEGPAASAAARGDGPDGSGRTDGPAEGARSSGGRPENPPIPHEPGDGATGREAASPRPSGDGSRGDVKVWPLEQDPAEPGPPATPIPQPGANPPPTSGTSGEPGARPAGSDNRPPTGSSELRPDQGRPQPGSPPRSIRSDHDADGARPDVPATRGDGSRSGVATPERPAAPTGETPLQAGQSDAAHRSAKSFDRPQDEGRQDADQPAPGHEPAVPRRPDGSFRPESELPQRGSGDEPSTENERLPGDGRAEEQGEAKGAQESGGEPSGGRVRPEGESGSGGEPSERQAHPEEQRVPGNERSGSGALPWGEATPDNGSHRNDGGTSEAGRSGRAEGESEGTGPQPDEDGSGTGPRPEEEEKAERPDTTSNVPYTPRFFALDEIPDYNAPEPPDDAVWENPNPTPPPPQPPKPPTPPTPPLPPTPPVPPPPAPPAPPTQPGPPTPPAPPMPPGPPAPPVPPMPPAPPMPPTPHMPPMPVPPVPPPLPTPPISPESPAPPVTPVQPPMPPESAEPPVLPVFPGPPVSPVLPALPVLSAPVPPALPELLEPSELPVSQTSIPPVALGPFEPPELSVPSKSAPSVPQSPPASAPVLPVPPEFPVPPESVPNAPPQSSVTPTSSVSPELPVSPVPATPPVLNQPAGSFESSVPPRLPEPSPVPGSELPRSSGFTQFPGLPQVPAPDLPPGSAVPPVSSVLPPLTEAPITSAPELHTLGQPVPHISEQPKLPASGQPVPPTSEQSESHMPEQPESCMPERQAPSVSEQSVARQLSGALQASAQELQDRSGSSSGAGGSQAPSEISPSYSVPYESPENVASQPISDGTSDGIPGDGAGDAYGRRRGGAWFPSGGPVEGPGVLVRSLAGFGDFAELDTETGALRAAGSVSPEAAAEMRGVVGSFDDTTAVFYRDRQGLMLRIGNWAVHLDEPGVTVDWARTGEASAQFRVLFDGVPLCDMRYRSTVPDNDIGMFVHDVLGNAARRSRLFAGAVR